MKVLFSWLVALMFSICLYAQNCDMGSIVISSQQQIDNFSSDFPNCSIFNGDITIEEDTENGEIITNLLGLSQLTHIEGNFIIRDNDNLSSLVGLGNIKRISHKLEMVSNDGLLTLEGLEGLEYIGRDLILKESLGSLTGLGNLDTINRDFILPLDNEVTSTIGLDELKYIGRDFKVLGKSVEYDWASPGPFLSFGDLDSLTEIGRNFIIGSVLHIVNGNGYEYEAPSSGVSLTSIDGFQNLKRIGGSLEIKENWYLNAITGFQNLERIGDDGVWGSLIIQNNGLDSLLAFQKLNHINNDLHIASNSFDTLAGFDSLAYVRGDFILDNFSLASLPIFDKLLHIGGSLSLSASPANLNSFEQLSHLGGGLSINSQHHTDISSFQNINHVINGDLILKCRDLLSLNNFSHIDSVVGDLIIEYGHELTSLDGLQNLNAIDGDLRLKYNSSLESLAGLENLSSISGGLYLSHCGLNDLSAIQQITELEFLTIFSNDNLQTLEDFQNLTIIEGGISILDNASLTSLSGLPVMTTVGGGITIRNNDMLSDISYFENLTHCGGSLFIIDCDMLSDLSVFENLTYINSNLKIENNDLITELSAFDNLTHVNNIDILYNNQLASLPDFQFLDTIGWLRIIGHPSLQSLSGIEAIRTIRGNLKIEDNDALLSLDGLKVNALITGGQSSRYLHVRENELLQDIAALSDFYFNALTSLEISDNPNLAICEEIPICNAIAYDVGYSSFHDNAPGCNSELEVLEACANVQSKLNYAIYYDQNQNEIQDEDEQFLFNSSILIEPIGIEAFANTYNTIFLPEGEYTVVYNESNTPLWSMTGVDTVYQLSINNDPLTCDSLYFGLYPNEFNSIVTSFFSPAPLRCNEFSSFDIYAKNAGTTVVSEGILWFEMDHNILEASFVDTPDTLVAPNTVGWFFQDLYPGQHVKKDVSLLIPGVDEVEIGSLLECSSFLDFVDENNMQTSDTFSYTAPMVCSYDPNDKLVIPARDYGFTKFEEQLVYTVRFQNTGNAEAYHVKIRDTLDVNLDASTFLLLGSSHEHVLTTSLTDNKYLLFDFQYIFLPDSTTNPVASQGYVSYSIMARDNIPEETIIQNSAAIYFDHNPAIITNTTENLMVSIFDVDEDGFNYIDDCDDEDALINPAADEIANNETDEDCDGEALIIDGDQDGYNSDVDCDDQDPLINPEAEEIANNGIDEDCDGEDLLSNTSIHSDYEINMFPNPTADFLNVEYHRDNKLSYIIVDIWGRKRLKGQLKKGSNLIGLNELEKGVYIVFIRDKDFATIRNETIIKL